MTGTRNLLGVDVGGTFTDFVAYDPGTRKAEVWKELSTPDDPVSGIIAGLPGMSTVTGSPICASAPRWRPTPSLSGRAPSSPM